jgi:hypothetical protein
VRDQPFQSPESAYGIQPLWFLVTPENVLDADGKFLEIRKERTLQGRGLSAIKRTFDAVRKC